MIHQPIPAADPATQRPKGLRARIGALREFLLNPPEPDPLLCGKLEEDGYAPLARYFNDAVPLMAAPVTDRAGAEGLEALVCEAQRALGQLDVLVRESGDDARAYGAALESNAAGFDEAADQALVIERLAELTRTMIGRTQRAEERLRLMSGEIDTLQENLAEARSLVGQDSLTGLPNRAALEERLAELAAAASRLGAPLALAFCDVDHFKRVNDEFGHAVGDRVLKLVADTLAADARAGETVGRWGGEEFLMLFENMGAAQAGERVDAIRRSLSGRSLRVRGTDQPVGSVSFSAGVAALLAGEEPRELVARADEALLAAKRDGRDRVILAGRPAD